MPRFPLVSQKRPNRWRGSPFRLLDRRPWLYWVAVGALTVTTAWVASDLVAGARRARDQWGEHRTVLVAARTVAPGELLTDADVERRDLPLVAIPPGAVHSLDAEVTTVGGILPGEVVVEARLSGAGQTAFVPAGTAAVAVATGVGSPPLEPGDRVQLWATADPFGSVAGLPEMAQPVARTGRVLEAGDAQAMIAVDEADLAATTAALARGTVTVVLVAR